MDDYKPQCFDFKDLGCNVKPHGKGYLPLWRAVCAEDHIQIPLDIQDQTHPQHSALQWKGEEGGIIFAAFLFAGSQNK